MNGTYKHIHPVSKLAVVALVVVICMLVFSILSFVLAIPIFGKGVFQELISSSLSFDSSNVNLLKYLQTVQSIGLFIVPSFILAYLFNGNAGRYLYLDRKPFAVSIILALAIIYSASPLINVLGIWNSNMSLPDWLSGVEAWMRQSEESAEALTELFVKANSVPALLFNVLMIGIIPAIGEELLFRGVIQRIFTEWTGNKHIAIWITAILFSALHLQFYGFIPRALLGAMFGYLLIWSGNLWLPVLAHFINNTTAVIAYYLYHNGTITIDPDTLGTNSEYGIGAMVSLILVAGLFVIYYSFGKRKRLEV